VRSYLLGTLDERDAEALELKYFSDPQFLQWMKEVETELVNEYFEDQLSTAQRERFEERYNVKIPELRQQYDQTHSRPLRQSPRTITTLRWKYPVGALLVAVVVISPLVVWRLRSRNPSSGDTRVLLAVHLTPGVAKSEDSKQVEFASPQKGQVRFSFELPGRISSIDSVVTLRLVDARAEATPSWSSPITRSHNQELNVEVDSALLRPGDYIAQVSTQGTVIEAYSFRVLP
jgi:hypothetical protein